MPYVTEDNLTDVVLERWKDIPDPRLRQIMQSLIKHVHGFVREIEPTQAEWAVAIDWLTRTGKLCSEKRQEFILTSDVLGVSMLVDAINHRRPSGSDPEHGRRTVPRAQRAADRERRRYGPRSAGHSLLRHRHGARARRRAGRRAVLDLWQTDGEGLYEDQRDISEAVDARPLPLAADGSYRSAPLRRSPIPSRWTAPWAS